MTEVALWPQLIDGFVLWKNGWGRFYSLKFVMLSKEQMYLIQEGYKADEEDFNQTYVKILCINYINTHCGSY